MRILAAILALGLALLGRAEADPKVDANALLLPTFLLEDQPPLSAGFAFLFEEEGQRYAATAYHIFGPPGGLPRKLSPREVPRAVKALAGLCLGDTHTVVVAQPALYVEDARAVDPQGAEADVTIFQVPDTRVKAVVRLASVPAKAGQKVWLLARLVDRAEARLYPAKVLEAAPKVLRYQFENAELNLIACSGAPVVDEFGRVAGMHLGFDRKDKLTGIAIPAAAVRERLKAAVGEDK